MTDVTGIDPRRPVERTVEARRADEHDFAKTLARQRDQAKPTAESADRAGASRLSVASTPAADRAGTVQAARASEEAVLLPTQRLLDIAVQPVGVTQTLRDARVYGMHALAGAYLSELAVADADVPAAKPAATGAGAPEDLGVTAPAAPAAVSAAMPAADEAKPAVTTAATLPLLRILSTVPESASPPVDPVTTALAGTQARWPDSLLRLVRQRDGGTVAWIRDYRVQAGEVPALVARLRDCARAEGTVLNKIMLNGREAWSSQQTG